MSQGFVTGASLPVPLPVESGGTELISLTPNTLLTGGATSTSPMQQVLAGSANQMLQSGGAGALPAFSTATWPATTTINQLLYSSANNTVSQVVTANNGILVTSPGGVPSIGNTVGAGLTMPSLTFNSTAGIVGTTTNDNAAAGSVGEFIDSGVIGPTNITTSSVAQNMTSISLTAGDWDVYFQITIENATTVTGNTTVSISTISATLAGSYGFGNATSNNSSSLLLINYTGYKRISLSSTTTIYLVAGAVFTAGNPVFNGQLGARRVR